MSARLARTGSGGAELWDTVRAVVIAVAAALLIRHFVLETYQVNGVSMEPTLQNGERIMVNKLALRFGPPRIGEVIVFHPPLNTPDDFVKRIIALGGQTFSMRSGTVYVDGQVQPEPYLPSAWRSTDSFPSVTVPKGDVWVLGDHRGDSEDSRIFGPVPITSIRGVAEVIWWPPKDFRLLGAKPAG